MLAFLRWYRGILYLRKLDLQSDNIAKDRPRHLLVDVSVLRSKDSRTGIQRVVRAMLIEMSQMTLANMVVQPVFATQTEPYRYCDLAFLDRSLPAHTLSDGGVVVPRAGDVFLGLDLAAHLLPIHECQITHWKRQGVSLFVIVYDLLPLLDRNWFTAKLRRRFRSWLNLIARHMDGAICISNAVAIELENVLSALGKKTGSPLISTIPLGGDIIATLPSLGLPVDSEVVLNEIRSQPSILMVGTIEPRKAYDKALAAFERLWHRKGDAAPKLLIVGRAGWKTEALQERLRTHPQSGKVFHWLEDVSDEFLGQLYDAATGVLMTSYAEGCGLPVLEALTHRKPVLARDLAVFREVPSDYIFFFQDDDPDALATSIEDFICCARQNTGGRMIDSHRSWSNTARALINVIEAPLGIP